MGKGLGDSEGKAPETILFLDFTSGFGGEGEDGGEEITKRCEIDQVFGGD